MVKLSVSSTDCLSVHTRSYTSSSSTGDEWDTVIKNSVSVSSSVHGLQSGGKFTVVLIVKYSRNYWIAKPQSDYVISHQLSAKGTTDSTFDL